MIFRFQNIQFTFQIQATHDSQKVNRKKTFHSKCTLNIFAFYFHHRFMILFSLLFVLYFLCLSRLTFRKIFSFNKREPRREADQKYSHVCYSEFLFEDFFLKKKARIMITPLQATPASHTNSDYCFCTNTFFSFSFLFLFGNGR